MAEGLLSGLEAFGLSGLEEMSLFEDEKKAQRGGASGQAAQVVELTEKDFLLDKSMKCPLCDEDFKARMVKGGKAKLLGTDMDLRPKYKELDIVKYDVIMCPECGYTALSRYFPTVLSVQRQRIKEKISANFKPQREYPETISYDQAIERYKMALVNAVVKGCKASEKAYICLKASWVVRGKAQDTVRGDVDYEKIMAELKDDENELLHNALEGFVSARASEHFPIAGMDEMTLDYLMAVLFINEKDYNNAAKLVYDILNSKTASSRLKEKARDLKDEILNRDK